MALLRLRRGNGTPAALLDGEPALDLTVARPRLFAGVNGTPRLIVDHEAYVQRAGDTMSGILQMDGLGIRYNPAFVPGSTNNVIAFGWNGELLASVDGTGLPGALASRSYVDGRFLPLRGGTLTELTDDAATSGYGLTLNNARTSDFAALIINNLGAGYSRGISIVNAGYSGIFVSNTGGAAIRIVSSAGAGLTVDYNSSRLSLGPAFNGVAFAENSTEVMIRIGRQEAGFFVPKIDARADGFIWAWGGLAVGPPPTSIDAMNLGPGTVNVTDGYFINGVRLEPGGPFLPLTGGALANPGNLNVAGVLTADNLQEGGSPPPRVTGDYTLGLDAIRRIQPRTYEAVDGTEQIGLVAADLQDALPQAIAHIPTLQPVEEEAEESGLLGIGLMALIVTLINAVKELDTQVAELTRSER